VSHTSSRPRWAYATRIVGFRQGRRRLRRRRPRHARPSRESIYGDERDPGRIFVALVVLAWLVWDTGADPVRLAGRAVDLDFLRRMMPPDLRVLPRRSPARSRPSRIALLGTAVAAVLALPLAFSPRATWPGAVFYPARAVLNSCRSVDTLVYALIFVARSASSLPRVLAVVAYTTTSLAKLYPRRRGHRSRPVDASPPPAPRGFKY